MTIADLLARLAAVPPADVPALRLDAELQQLEAAGDVSAIVARLADIETALESLNHQLDQAKRTTTACQSLSPVPAKQIPWGI